MLTTHVTFTKANQIVPCGCRISESICKEVSVTHGLSEYFTIDNVIGSYGYTESLRQTIDFSLQSAQICWLKKLCLFLVQNVQSVVENLLLFFLLHSKISEEWYMTVFS